MYGGTKTEMERLLKDAQALTGVKYDINNLADVYSAIHAIQENLGIAGTTAKESEATISGSAQMMKSAWENVLTAISGGGDLDRAINNLVYSVQKYFENIVPVVERALQGIGTLIEKVAPLLVQAVAKALIKAIPSLLNAVYQMIIGLAKGIYEGITALFSGEGVKAIEKQTSEIKQSVKNQNALTDAVDETAEAQEKSLAGFDKLNILSSKSAAEEEAAIAMPTTSGGATASLLSDTSATETQFSGFVKRMMVIFQPFTTAISKAFNSLKVGFVTLKKPLQDLWNNALKPIVEAFGGWINDIIGQTSKSFDYVSEKLVEYEDEITGVINGISAIIQVIWSVLKPIIDSVIQGIWPVLKTTIDFIFSIIQAVGNFFDFFKNIFSGIKALIKGDTEEAQKYFKKALGNFVNIFVGIGNAIISVVNNLWTLIFDAFKGTVNSIGGLVSKIGEWLGFDWDLQWNANAPLIPLIPKYVPKLAQGAVIPPNREFMAILGDQTSGMNIEAPEDLIRQIVREESGSKNFTIKATGSMAQLIRMLSLQVTEEQNRVSVF